LIGCAAIGRVLPDAAATERLGAELARALPWSVPQALIAYLEGDLGAGKTTLVRGLLRQLGVAGTVRSPSYTLLETYECSGHRILHLDLYRLAGSADVASLGLRDELDPGVLLLIEWPERAAGSLPQADLSVSLSSLGQGRHARIEASGAAGRAWLAAVGSSAGIQN
jgi:tRNA threonylcarbamoyladenosine biosynthesis protein TsaE